MMHYFLYIIFFFYLFILHSIVFFFLLPLQPTIKGCLIFQAEMIPSNLIWIMPA